jgi:nucleoid-associated protein YgaU
MVAITHLPDADARPALRLVADDERWIPLARVRAERPSAATFRARRAAVLALIALAVAAIAAVVTLAGRAPAHTVSTLPPGAGPVPAVEPIDAPEPVAAAVHIVQPGDTVWTIARALAEPGDDVRELVDRVVDANGGAALEVGQRLALP